MCFNATQLAGKLYKDAVRLGASKEELEVLKEKWQKAEEEENYLKAGFEHPLLHVIEMDQNSVDIKFHYWGLIPKWVRDEQQAKEIQRSTLNARGESMFEKPSFSEATKRRCIIPFDGYFEHHHRHGKTFPYYIFPEGEDRLLIGGIVSEWTNPLTGEVRSTVAAVSTTANQMLAEIHNNPKKEEARMLLILDDLEAKQWLNGSEDEIKSLIKPNLNVKLKSRTVARLTGKEAVQGEKVIAEKYYQELNEQGSLF